MKSLTGLALVLAVASGDASDRHELGWLLGCWVSADGGAHEVWVQDSDQLLLGFGVVSDGGNLGFYEVLSIRRGADGSFVYTAYPSGQSAASFVATEIGHNSVVFTNPDHDYPQEIRYERERNQLSATISRLGGVDANSFDKTACE